LTERLCEREHKQGEYEREKQASCVGTPTWGSTRGLISEPRDHDPSRRQTPNDSGTPRIGIFKSYTGDSNV